MRMKWIERPAPRIRFLRLDRLRRRDSRFLFGTLVDEGSEGEAAGCPPPTEKRKNEPVKPGAWLLKEVEETNHWARLAFQLYFGWFALQFIVNFLGLCWLYTYNGPKPWFASLVLLVIIGWNLMGTIGTVLVYKSLAASDARIQEIIERTAKLDVTGTDSWFQPQSPIPRSAIGTVFAFCAVSMFIALVFWIVLFVSAS